MLKFAFLLFQHIHPKNLLRNSKLPKLFPHPHFSNIDEVFGSFLQGFNHSPYHAFPFLLTTLVKASFFLEYISLDQPQYWNHHPKNWVSHV